MVEIRMKASRGSRLAVLVGISVLEVVFRASATLVAQPLKRNVAGDGFVLAVPMFHLLLETACFPVSFCAWIGYCLYRSKRIAIQNWRYRLSMYILMAVLDCISGYAASIGLNIVPASIFTILGSSAIVFSILLMYMLTKKKLTVWHYVSVALTFISVCMLFFKTATSQDELKPAPQQLGQSGLPRQQVSFIVAMFCCLLSAFLIALIGVLHYIFFTHEKLKCDVATILENNAMQSLFVAIILLPVIFTRSEATTWPSVYQRIQQHGNPRTFFAVCVGIWLSKSVIMFSSVATTAFASALLTRALGGPRRLLVMVVSWLIFKESMPLIKLGSGLLMLLSTAVYAYGGYQLQQQSGSSKRLESDFQLQSRTKQPV